MEYTRLGKTGLQVSKICIGCMSFGNPQWMGQAGSWVQDEESSLNMLRLAWEAGVNFIDTANVYSNGLSEIIVGKAIKKFNIPRSQVVVASKVYFPVFDQGSSDNLLTVPPNDLRLINGMGLSRKVIFDSVYASLERLQLDYLDILYIHRFDNNTPMEETMEALHDLVKAGKVRYLGASSMSAWQFVRLNAVAEKNGWTQLVVMQNYHNALYREEEREMVPYLQDQNIAMAPWSPLSQGLLARPLNEKTVRSSDDFILNALFGGGFSEADKTIINRVGDLAEKRGVSRAQIAIAWSLKKPFVTSPILGLGKERYLRDAVAAVKLKLTDEEEKYIDEAYQPKPVVGYHK
ncbi:NADP-dependent oxidoreductase domain-containing protein [Gongronella butleri]|nr:NADP-dependent oxidoreductase domain-containing protein [Gongronella butleri]